MDDLLFHLGQYLRKFELNSSKICADFGELISKTGTTIRYSFNHKKDGYPIAVLYIKIHNHDPFIVRISSNGDRSKEVLSIRAFYNDESNLEYFREDPNRIQDVLDAKLRNANVAENNLYWSALTQVKEKRYEKFVFISDGTLFSPTYQANFMVNGREFHSIQQYYLYSRALVQNQRDLAKFILREWDIAQGKKVEMILKNSHVELWFENSYKVIYNGINCRFLQNPSCMEQLIATREGVFIYNNSVDLYLGTGFCETDSIDDISNSWKGHNYYGYFLAAVRDDYLRIK